MTCKVCKDIRLDSMQNRWLRILYSHSVLYNRRSRHFLKISWTYLRLQENHWWLLLILENSIKGSKTSFLMMVLSMISLKISLKSWILSLKVNQLQQLSPIVTIKLRGELSETLIKWIISRTFRYHCLSKMARICLRLENKTLAHAFRTLSP